MIALLTLLACGATSEPPPRAAAEAPAEVVGTRGALDEPRKLALLVGIGAYDRATEGVPDGQLWRRLDGPPNNVAAMRAVLEAQGFQRGDVLVLEDEDATGEAIQRAFREHLGQAREGDIALFYFTGHGQQIPDDEVEEPDGFDESLVPWDSLGTRVYNKHLRDDLIEALIGEMRTDEVILIVDACNAGGLTRGSANLLGAPPAGEPAERGERLDGGSGLLPADVDSGYVLLSASQAARPAIELDPGRVPGMRASMGAMTWLLTHELSRPGAAQMTWRELAWRLRSQMPTLGQSQVPQIEGDINKQLFSGTMRDTERHHRARILEDGQNLQIEAGSLHGLDVGDALAVYKTGSDAPEEPVATATVREVELDEAYAVLDEGHQLYDAQADKGLEVRPLQDRVALYAPRIDLSQAPPEVRAQLERMARHEELEVVEGPEDQGPSDVLIRVVGGEVVLERGDGSRVPIPTDCGEEMASSIRLDTEMLGKLEQALILDRLRNRILGLHRGAGGLDISIEVRHVEATEDGRVTRDYGLVVPGGRGAYVRPGQLLQVTVNNGEDVDVFVTLLELRTDGGVETMYPYEGLEIDGSRVKANAGKDLGVFRMDEAGGQMAWKLIATERYVDFQSLEQRVRCSDGATRGLAPGSDPALSALLDEALTGDGAATRGHRDVGAWGDDVYFLRIED